MNRWRWAKKEFEWFGRRFAHAILGSYFVDENSFAGKGIASVAESNKFIYQGLMGDKPFATGRTGFTEVGLICCAQSEIFFNSRVHYYWTPSYINDVERFKNNGDLQKFRNIMMESMGKMDAIGTFRDMFMSDAVLEMVPGIEDKMIFDIDILNGEDNLPFRWTNALEGKKVLIVSPFYKEIAIQYEKRDLLWNDGRIPECDLSFDPSIWVDSDERSGYFDALETLSERVLKRDFEVALLSCGHIALPLAARIKDSGRKVIQMGSPSHRLFGIKGKRFDDHVVYNEYWISPGEESKPVNAEELDGGTYW